MAKTVLTGVRYFVGPADLTSQTNKVELEWSAEDKDVTTYGSGGKKERIAGVEDVTINAGGPYEAGGTGYADDEWWNARRVIEAHTVTAQPGSASTGLAAGDAVFVTQAVRLSGKLFGPIGDVASFELGASGNAGLGRGMVLQTPGTPISADGNGTAVNMGALSAGQRLIASFHVFSVTGTNPTLAVTIESDTNQTFTGSPETRLTFTTATAIGSEVVYGSPAAHADSWYRAVFDIGGTSSPSFLVVVAIGIG